MIVVDSLTVANNDVHKILVDNGSSVDVLYLQAYERMGLKVCDLKPSPNLVYSFTGDSVVPLRVITLPMTNSQPLMPSWGDPP